MSLDFMLSNGSQVGIADLLRQLIQEFSTLIQQHIQLTKTELQAEGQRFSKVIILGVIALFFIQGFIVSFSILLIILLIGFLHLSLIAAAAIGTGLFLLATALCALLAFQQLKSAQRVMPESQAVLQKDIQDVQHFQQTH